jgi:hypothetical protein
MENHGEVKVVRKMPSIAIIIQYAIWVFFLSDLEKSECEANDALYWISYAHDWGCLNLQHET